MAEFMTMAGTILDGKYKILKEIGRGGMSVVYLAVDMRLNKQWAVKEIKNENGDNYGALLKNLRIEAEILKKADHPVLPRIVDIIPYRDKLCVVMDYIEGRTLSDLLEHEGAQAQEKAVEWAKDLAGALNYLHSMNPPVIYRDMKPSNIMVKPDGRVKLIDFGAAKEFDPAASSDTVALGTRGYAAPEQFGDASGRSIHLTDERTDIYNLGATIYHTVTGKNPNEPPYSIMPVRHWNKELSTGLEKIILKCTRPDPNDRYQTCKELIYALEHYRELDDAYLRMRLKKTRSLFISAALALVFLFVSVTGYAGMKREQKRNYESLITNAYRHIIKGEYEQAATVYVDAITNVDSRKNTAYIELLKLYVNYFDDPETGLDKVVYYMKSCDMRIENIDELIMQVAMAYFETEKDYKKSAYYFDMLDEDKYKEAGYYRDIAMAMGETGTDYEALYETLKLFERENDKAAVNEDKLMNYRLLCIVYCRCMNQINEADERLVSAAKKGLETAGKCDDVINAGYYAFYNQYMAAGLEHLAGRYMGKDKAQAVRYYIQALECCDFILSMVPNREESTLGIVRDEDLREAKYCQRADILTVLGEYEEAEKTYEKAENEYKDSIALYVGHLALLCKIEEKKTSDIECWNYKKLKALYEKGEKIEGISDDYRWRQLTVKLSPLFGENEE